MHLQFCRDCNSVKQEQTGTAVLSTVCEWISEQMRDVFAPHNHILVTSAARWLVCRACAVP